jgi:hypothetical protein
MKRTIFFVFLALGAALAACSNNGTEGKLKPNEPPNVWLSAAPPEGSTNQYRIHLFWGGWDPDGEIGGYEYLISDNQSGVFQPSDTVGADWVPVLANDSTFTFSADQEVDTLNTKMISEFARSHTFFIRSIDREGMRSARPAYRSFTARTLSPEVVVDVPVKVALNAAMVPPITTFRWHASDPISDLAFKQEPDSVQWALARVPDSDADFRNTIEYLGTPAAAKEWQPWVYYKAPQDSGKFWTTPVIDYGRYVFAIRAKDEAGAITPVLDEGTNGNVRRVQVGQLVSGPLMTVTNDYIGVIRTSICSEPARILDSPAGVPLDFTIQGDASSYGGTIAGYRYGWDIPDLNDPEQWEIDLTPFIGHFATVPQRSFFFGTHTLTMEVQDNNGYCSRIEVKVNIVPFTLERNLLVIDDYEEPASAGWDNLGEQPTDQEHDAFWIDMVSELANFDPAIDMINTKSKNVPLATIAQYKSVVWDVYSDVATRTNLATMYDFIQHRLKNPPTDPNVGVEKVKPNILALAMGAGSHIMICGRMPVQLVCSRRYTRGAKFPIIFRYELECWTDQSQQHAPDVNDPETTTGDLSFAYRELCLETLDFSIQSTGRSRLAGQYCRIDYARPHPGSGTSAHDDSMREALPLDPNFPTLGLRVEAAGPGKWYEESNFGLDSEVYNPEYFRKDSGSVAACAYVPVTPRSCFQPIYGLGCIDTGEPTYNDPIAFWTSAYADRVAQVPGAVAARSVVFGFEPAFMTPSEFEPAMKYILFDEWKLPKVGGSP